MLKYHQIASESSLATKLINWRIPTRRPNHASKAFSSNPLPIVVAIVLHSHLMPKITKQFHPAPLSPPPPCADEINIFLCKNYGARGVVGRRWEKYSFRMRKESWLEVFSSFFLSMLSSEKITSSTSTPIVMRRSEKWEKKENVENVIFIHVRSAQLPARNRKDKKDSLSALGFKFFRWCDYRYRLKWCN